MIVKTFLPGVIVNSIRKRKGLNETEWIWWQTLNNLNLELIEFDGDGKKTRLSF